ncbi:MAG: FTR1 family protein [Ancalomicrobiaceae bacterium]|nr:FTR1 family protein [Ancalomicrobiaceae bacterium]
MLGTLIIVFREVIEAGLVVGIVLSVTRGLAGRMPWILGGIFLGVAGALLLAIFAGTLAAALEGIGQELFNAAVLTTAVLMLTWHNVWMARHGREIAAEIQTVGKDVARGSRSLAALAVVVGIAVLREGSEVVLFLYGVALSGHDTVAAQITGGFLGLALGAGLSAFTYLGLVAIPTRYLFAVTGMLITFLAAGMAAQAVAFLEQADVITLMTDTVWDTSWLLTDSSIAGRVLHTLIGYVDRPTGMEVVAYVAVLAAMTLISRAFAHRPTGSKLSATAAQ